MKLIFDANLPYQQQAIQSTVELFTGQPSVNSEFTVARVGQTGLFDGATGIGNDLRLTHNEILANLQNIQLKNGLPQTKSLNPKKYDFDIEMETGTGKTYVYLRTILELRKRYGFAKFIIVVPNIAIKEGVYKSIQITKDHLKSLYDNIIYDPFIYDSSKLEQVRSFATSDTVQIMVINIDAFRRSFDDPASENKANIIHRPNDKLNGMKPIDLIAETHPIVLIDEPQSVDTTPKAKDAIASLNPLCTLRYSATHVEKHDLIYKLDAVDAYGLGLVKQIEVTSFASVDYHNKPYMRLVSTENSKTPITAKIEMDVEVKGEIKRKTVTLKQGDDLYIKSGGREVYENYLVDDISCVAEEEAIYLNREPGALRKGKVFGNVDDLVIKDQQIRKTIEEHLDKELILNPKGIKVLSLFFLDRVDNYYGEDGEKGTGPYAKIFETHYTELIQRPKYKTLRHKNVPAKDTHNGYFSRDKQKRPKDTRGDTQADDEAYALIMKDKEKLLSFDSDLRFIFSHSALREGWDNPNVFQICTLNESVSEVKKRQEIGRGLRLCVDQRGVRHHESTINILTVMANESYEEFAAKLQKEYEEGGIRFGVLEPHTFANIPVKTSDGNVAPLGSEKSNNLFDYFVEKEYIDKSGRIQNSLISDLKDDKVELPKEFAPIKNEIIQVCKKSAGKLPVRDSNKRQTILRNKEVFLSREFNELWEKIKYKTTYSVEFDSDKLIESCTKRMKELVISSAKVVYTKAEVNVSLGGVETKETARQSVTSEIVKEILPDITLYLQNRTNLTRKTITNLLITSDTLDKFKKNPQKYMEEVAEIILSEMRKLLIDGIKYTRIGDEEYYTLELMFPNDGLTGHTMGNLFESKKSVYDYVICDSSNEFGFAERFEINTDIKLYAKLPGNFKIPTPLGTYNPDWAVLIERNGTEKLYFVLETKGSIMGENLRGKESGKIACGKKHFEALDVTFKAIDNFNEFIENI
ncbi:MAG: DEAD/DEAH box helicase family protein [Methanocorpusculum sp.]|uniref:type III restriction-modification system endonuclease n=1 Tax=Methanocorpusculum sp. TaxID=2058474 RepID=UPI002B220F06|nr:DEAD/DEAH box helicase family protein [Methanocorpusculum sp.]MEA5087259.1 DEAD/DEAH box helicase family protein [Methanocorpusculum sp.]